MAGYEYTVLIPLIPLVMFLVLGLSSGTMKKEISGYLGTSGYADHGFPFLFYCFPVLF